MNAIKLAIIFICFSLMPIAECRSIYNQILRNNKHIDKVYARELEVSLLRVCKDYNIPCDVFTAILSVESDYLLWAKNKSSNDYGIGQINIYNVKALDLDTHKLLTNLDYSLDWTAFIFKWFYKTYRKQGIKVVIARYNCGTKPSCINYRSVKRYVKKVLNRR